MASIAKEDPAGGEMWRRKNPAGLAAGGVKDPAMTYFRAESTIIGPKCLTAVFGMGTGVSIWVWSPASRLVLAYANTRNIKKVAERVSDSH